MTEEKKVIIQPRFIGKTATADIRVKDGLRLVGHSLEQTRDKLVDAIIRRLKKEYGVPKSYVRHYGAFLRRGRFYILINFSPLCITIPFGSEILAISRRGVWLSRRGLWFRGG